MLTVHDNGPGIPSEHLPLIFDRFYKADLTKGCRRQRSGALIVKAIVELHGGTISVRNDNGAVSRSGYRCRQVDSAKSQATSELRSGGG